MSGGARSSFPDLRVRGTHPCKERKDGAPSVVVIPAKIKAGPPATSDDEDITPDFTVWGTDNPNVVKLSTKKAQAIGAGFTYGYANGDIPVNDGCGCLFQSSQPTLPSTVFDVGVYGKNYILVGSDPNVLLANQFQVTNSAHDNAPQPPGGTCCAASSDSSDKITQVPGDNPPSFQFETADQSSVVGDRTLTFEYDLSNGGTAVQVNVTARKFAYLTNNNPSNTCTLKYGTNRSYVYNVYTHPDRQPIAPGIAQGTAVTESFNPALTCQTITGNGSLNGNAQIIDQISSGCSNTPLTCSQTSTQSISVAGYPVRSNKLQWTSTGVTYTNNGPTQ